MISLLETAHLLGKYLDDAGFSYCVIGGLAVQRWGEPRYTQDVDITLLTGFGGEAQFVDTLLDRYRPRIESARDFALANRVLLVCDESGVPIDIALGAMPFEERAVARSTKWRLEAGSGILTCSAEDLVVHKAFAARDRDWLDIDGIVRRQTSLDWELIFDELVPLVELKEAPEIVSRLRKIALSS